jgi:tetratricopeptide (TPR) repeat protein
MELEERFLYNEEFVSIFEAGLILQENKKYTDAIQAFNECIGIYPDCSSVYFLRALMYRNLNYSHYALKDFNKSIELNPFEESQYYHRGLCNLLLKIPEQAVSDLTRAISYFPDPETYFYRGRAYYETRDFENAIEDYTKAIEGEKDRALIYRSRADCYFILDKLVESLSDYNNAVYCSETDEDRSRSYNERGNYYLNTKEYIKAIDDYTRAIELDPEEGIPYSNRGMAYAELKLYSRAMEEHTKAVNYSPCDVDVYLERGRLCHKLRVYGSAIKDFTKAIKLVEDTEESHPLKAELYYNRGLSYLYYKNNCENSFNDWVACLETNYNYKRGLEKKMFSVIKIYNRRKNKNKKH